MRASPIPPDNRRPDWPRLVASKTAEQDNRLAALEVNTLLFALDCGNAAVTGTAAYSIEGGGA